jgi:hypothetical protein
VRFLVMAYLAAKQFTFEGIIEKTTSQPVHEL